jgi:tetratricopeptide (TPR) repeat protein
MQDDEPRTGRRTSRDSKKPSRKRRWILRVLAVALGLLPFVIAEGIARSAGYGGYPPVLKRLETVAGKTYVASYQPGIDSFFRRNLTVTGGMNEQVFTVPADPDTVRIFCVGGSAMQGYPQPRTLVASSFFQAMLADLWPHRTVEVLNLGVTAIASFPVDCILEEALDCDPDLVIIYSGNNEFYGACGVASLHAFGRSTAAMRAIRTARRSALVQWLDLRIAASHKPTLEEENQTLMERVIAHDQIGPQDTLRQAAGDNLDRHLRQMIRRCRERKIPVIVCTLPANERDLWPLGEDIEPALSGQNLAAFQQNLKQSEQELPSDPGAAAERLQSAIQIYDRHARSHFLLGRALDATGRPEDAQLQYREARELDTMPWRAPGSFNARIRDAAQEGAILCDLQRAFEETSPGGAIGWELMDDHVHPSLHGQALVAETWLRSMADLPEPLRVNPDDANRLPGWTEYAARLGTNQFDTYASARRMVNLFETPFYQRSNPEGLERYASRLAEIEASLGETERVAVHYWHDPETHQQRMRPIAGIAGAGLMTEGRFEEADRLLCIARRNVPRYSLWNLELTWKALECRRQLHPQPRPEDLALVREMIRDGQGLQEATGVSSPVLEQLLRKAYELSGQYEQSIQEAARQSSTE